MIGNENSLKETINNENITHTTTAATIYWTCSIYSVYTHLTFKQPYEITVAVIIISILYLRKQSLREIKSLAQDHTVSSRKK